MTLTGPAAPPSVGGRGEDDPIGVVVVSYGSAELLRRNLAPLELPGDRVRVIVVDNYSTDDNRRAVEALGAEHGWTVVGLPDNRGFGVASNAGAAVAGELGCRSFLFLNPDARISREVVGELRIQSLREPLALISPQLVDSAGEVVFRAARTDLRDGRVHRRPDGEGLRTRDPGDWLCGACLVVHADLFARIGGFDEGFFLYWEDVDLGYRAVAAGASVVLREDLVAVHDEGGTHDGRGVPEKSALYYRWNCRNRLAFGARHLSRSRLLHWILTTPAVSWEILMRGGRRQLLRFPGLLWAAVAGSLAGLRLALPALLHGRLSGPAGRPAVLVVHAGAELYGSDRVLLESVGALVASAEVTVALPCSGPLVAQLERGGARVVVLRMPVLRKSLLHPAGLLLLLRDAALGLVPMLRLVRRHGRDGVYVNTTVLPAWVLLARLARRRVVVHVHEAEWPGPTYLKRLLLAPLKAADRVIANSAFTRTVLTALLPSLAERTVVVANPVRGPGQVRSARGRLDGPLRLLYVGRLSSRKGPDVAVAALGELVDRGVDVRLTLAGSVFPGYEWFEQQVRAQVAAAGLGERVLFLGFCPDTSALLAEADIVLVPSVRDESFGNSAVEGVLAARPTV
ncbi:MAG: hypothetical protein JWO98_3434, partial [Frankiales bacterium]|nr:hypothetical protein [Frankiales bacterium]